VKNGGLAISMIGGGEDSAHCLHRRRILSTTSALFTFARAVSCARTAGGSIARRANGASSMARHRAKATTRNIAPNQHVTYGGNKNAHMARRRWRAAHMYITPPTGSFPTANAGFSLLPPRCLVSRHTSRCANPHLPRLSAPTAAADDISQCRDLASVDRYYLVSAIWPSRAAAKLAKRGGTQKARDGGRRRQAGGRAAGE